MNYNLKDFFTSIKLNTHRFEELSFANSYFSMPKKDLDNILFAENDDKKNQTANIENDYLDASYIEIDDNKKSLMDRIKDTINNIFKPKPKTYKLTDGQSVEIDGTMPGSPIVKFFNRIANSLDKIKNKGKEIKDAAEIKNSPQVISEYPIKADEKGKKDPSLLNEGKYTSNPNLNLGTITQSQKAKTQGSFINSNPDPIGVETLNVDKEEVLKENKEMISDLLEKTNDSDKNRETTETTITHSDIPPKEDKSDDLTI